MTGLRYSSGRVLGALVVLGGFAVPATAQIGTATFAWEAFVDGQWRGGSVQTTATDVPVRVRVSWSQDAGYAFASAQFDAVISVPTSASDAAVNPIRPRPFDSASQTLAVTRFGNQLKIDDQRDTFAPGLGTRGTFPSQGVEGFGYPISTANPAVVFSFNLRLGATMGTRLIEALPLAPFNGNSTDRWMRIYTTSGGAQNTPLVTQQTLELTLIPAPASAALLVVGLVAARRRRGN